MATSVPLQVSDFLNYKGLNHSHTAILCEFYSFLATRPRPITGRETAPENGRSPYDGVLEYLRLAETRERNPHRRADLRQSWLYVSYEAEHNPIAFIQSSYAIHGCHPDKVWPQFVTNRKAILGRQYSRWFDAAGDLIPERLDIPDYDPTSQLLPRCAIPRIENPSPVSREKYAWPKAPLRLIVRRRKVVDGHYHEERLECGHTHIEFLDANPGNRRRRCRKCANA